MRKTLVTALCISAAVVKTVSAQNYYAPAYYGNAAYNGGGYYNTAAYPQAAAQTQAVNPQAVAYRPQQAQRSYGNTTYHAPHQPVQRKPREIGQISAGADYVIGYGSYADSDFTVKSALTDGNDFVSDTRDLDRSLNSVSFNLGWRPLRNFGIEAFYSTSLSEKKVVYTESYTHYPEFARGEYEVSYKAFGIDLLGYLPINDYIELIASIGVGKYDAEAKIKVSAYEDTSHSKLRSTNSTFTDSVTAYRIGGGVQFWLSKHLTFRAMARWTQLGGEFMDYITEVNMGVRYHF